MTKEQFENRLLSYVANIPLDLDLQVNFDFDCFSEGQFFFSKAIDEHLLEFIEVSFFLKEDRDVMSQENIDSFCDIIDFDKYVGVELKSHTGFDSVGLSDLGL